VPLTTLADLAILRGMQPAGRGDRSTGNGTGDAMHALGTTRPAARALAALAGAAALASVLAAAVAGAPRPRLDRRSRPWRSRG
jgi:hypothetical protein